METSDAAPRASLRTPAVVTVAWLALFVVTGRIVPQSNGKLGGLLFTGVYLVPHVSAIALSVRAARKTEGAERRLWMMLAFALPLWLGGELVYAFNVVILGRPPAFPGVPDVLFLGFYVVLVVAFIVGLRPALKIRSWKAILDSSVLSITFTYIGWATVVRPQLRGAPFDLRTLAGAAYPVLGIVMVTILLSFMLATYRRPPAALVLLIAAVCLGSCNDLTLAYASLHSSHPVLALNQIGWEAETLLIALAAYAAGQRYRLRSASAAGRDRGIVIVLLGTVAMLVAAVVRLMSGPFSIEIGILALYVGGALVLRLYLTTREREDLTSELEASLDEQLRLANTDELTGLRNRRYADRRLYERAMDQGGAGEMGVLIIDLDHFKDVNDVYGHPAGDIVLRTVSQRLLEACRPGDIVARYGGEEFLVIMHELERDELASTAERFRAAVADAPITIGSELPVIVTASVGGASIPVDAATLTELLRIADRALYTAKGSGRNRVQVGAQADEGSIEALMERGTVLNFVQSLVDRIDENYNANDHARETTRLAGLTADELRLTAEERWRTTAGARLHDIGKICIPSDILRRAGPLNDEEWKLLRRHPDVGADMLALAPGLGDLATGVRQHHERHDGTGYPQGLAGDGISIEARIISVCDAWCAMTADRPYDDALTDEAASAELRRHSGTQFDPRVVAAFSAAQSRDVTGPPNLLNIDVVSESRERSVSDAGAV